ncbi:phage host-nuclease inhibitor protein Gam [Paucibacter oligotrophus]|uniref:Phage host-nuclease inhibitor protein Gam n=1 Tax=Roseateles oligotrophus TaxID=1769250 RepID=A0A840LIC8_9BURK|nr:host-nuclease inhibitor Gam family protein [Roseateles oligotrophus]MBB4845017.1 phage host-nuclease inhibitor protein Gam [Roseateles oligotrophus]
MATRIKAKAAVQVPQTKTDCAADIKLIGDLQRDFERQRAEMNDQIAEITKQYQPGLEALQGRLLVLQEGVQSFCEAHRETLCGKGKTANLVTGEVCWRQRPPSVSIRGADSVMDTLLRMGLGRFVRVKNEPNKEAMLNEPDAVKGIAGIAIVSGVEDFVITPFEAGTEVAA